MIGIFVFYIFIEIKNCLLILQLGLISKTGCFILLYTIFMCDTFKAFICNQVLVKCSDSILGIVNHLVFSILLKHFDK